MWGIFTTKMLYNPSNDIEAWKIGHGYPYPDKLETAYYCIKEKKLISSSININITKTIFTIFKKFIIMMSIYIN